MRVVMLWMLLGCAGCGMFWDDGDMDSDIDPSTETETETESDTEEARLQHAREASVPA